MTPDEMKALIDEARRHVPYAGSQDDNWCIHCADEWPCVTRRLADALEAALSPLPDEETEWEYRVVDRGGSGQLDVPGNDPSWFVTAEWPEGHHLIRRRKAGLWEPVPEGSET